MIVVDKPALTRFARTMRAHAAQAGIKASHSVFLEAACAALGLRNANAAVALLRERPIVIGVPMMFVIEDETPKHLQDSSRGNMWYAVPDEYVANHAARFVAACGGSAARLEAICRERLHEPFAAASEMSSYEDGSLVTPDVSLSVPTMAAAAASRYATLSGIRESEGDAGKRAAVWMPIVAEGLKQGIMDPDGFTTADDADVAAALWSVRNSVGMAPRGGRWSRADQVLRTMLRAMGVDANTGSMNVAAEIILDDGHGQESFDATPFLRDADIEDIKELAECGWRGDYAADEVAWFVRELPGYEDVDALMTRMQKRGWGFEVVINEEQAMAWLAMHRPLAHHAIQSAGGGQPKTAAEMVECLSALAEEAAGNYADFRDLAIRFLDGLDSHDPDDEAWSAVWEVVRRPDTDDIDWIMTKAKSLAGAADTQAAPKL